MTDDDDPSGERHRDPGEDQPYRGGPLLDEIELTAGIGHWKWSEDGSRMIHCSEQAASIFGLAVPEMLDHCHSHASFLNLIHPDDRSWVDRKISEFYRSFAGGNAGEAFDIVYRIVQPAGAVRYVRESAGPRLRGSVSTRTVGTVQDVTERVTLQQALAQAKAKAEEESRQKSQFLSYFSHELRTPLNAIIGFADTIRQQVFGHIENERYRDYIDDIHASSNHLLDLINDILDISAIEAGQLTLVEDIVDLGDLVGSTVILLGSLADAAEVTLVTEIARPAPRVRADARRLRQVLVNLTGNAIKFSPPGAQIAITADRSTDGGARFTVEDRGAGMTPEELNVAMRPFGQPATLTRQQHYGSGLGLPLCEMLVEAHGGRFRLESRKGKGTRAIVCMPASRNA